MKIFFIGQEEHTATLYKSGHVVCSCGKVIDKTNDVPSAYTILEKHIRIKLNHKGSLVRGTTP